MALNSIPVEIRQCIFELVIVAPCAPASPSQGQQQQRRRCRSDTFFESGVWEVRTQNKALSLLLVSKQFHAEVQNVVRRLPESYHVDIMFVKDRGLWTTWDMPKLPASRYIDNVTATVRIFDPTDDIDPRFKWSLRFRPGCGGPEPAAWAFLDLLTDLINRGPGYLGPFEGHSNFIINMIDVNVVAPTDGAAHNNIECKDDENPPWLDSSSRRIGHLDKAPEQRVARYMTNYLGLIFRPISDGLRHCFKLHEHITDSVTFHVNGVELETFRLDDSLERCDVAKWDYYPTFRDRNAKTATQWMVWVTKRRERMKKGLEVDEEGRPDTARPRLS